MNLQTIKQIVEEYFGIQCEPKKLDGEVDLNFYIKDVKGHEYTFKISPVNQDEDDIKFQLALLSHLEKSNFPFAFPRISKSLNGHDFEVIKDDQTNLRIIRLQHWVPGKMLNDIQPRDSILLESWGGLCGELSKAMSDFDHLKAHRYYKWDPSTVLDLKSNLQYFKTQDQKQTANFFWDEFEHTTMPKLNNLRKSINHNDAHELNILVSQDGNHFNTSGVIDFGDAIYTHTINELSICCAYACMGMDDPLEAASDVICGYHKIFPLEDKEIEILFSMISARLLITVANAAYNLNYEPDNKYLQISAEPAWELLKKFESIPKQLAHYTFRAACGKIPCPTQIPYEKYLDSKPSLHPVIDLKDHSLGLLDLSIGSHSLGNNAKFNSATAFQQTIQNLLIEQEVEVGIGGYLETRPIYTTDAFKHKGNQGMEWRACHLGFDIWTKAGTPVFAPIDGIVKSIAYQNEKGDYGTVIILKHKISDKLTFYTLYGHLSKMPFVSSGDPIKAGDKIAELGNDDENGGWPPHLHFQIILDLLEEEQNFYGVCTPSKIPLFASICPDPILLISNLKNQDKSLHLSSSQIKAKRSKYLGRNLSISYQKPLHIVRGFKQHLYTPAGRRYLDSVNNVAHVGHSHPRIVEAASKQNAILNTNTRYLHENIVHYVEALSSTLPDALSVIYLVNSGSEANELALRMAKTYTKQKDIIALEMGYHGNTGNAVDVSSYKFDGKGGIGAPNQTKIIPIPDIFRGIYKDSKTAGSLYAKEILASIQQVKSEGRNIAGFICESILSCGGQIVLPSGFLQEAFGYIRKEDGLCIMDEVQVGFGRVGSHFWGFELQSVIPDIVTLGKPIGNGHPLGAVATTQKVADAFTNGMEYYNTFGGNPVSCAIGIEVLNIIKEEGLQQNALNIGQYFKEELDKLRLEHTLIGDVRGHGLFLGFELVENLKNLSPSSEKASYLSNRMREYGILTSVDGPLHNVIKIKPPMCFNRDNVDQYVYYLDKILKHSYMQI